MATSRRSCINLLSYTVCNLLPYGSMPQELHQSLLTSRWMGEAPGSSKNTGDANDAFLVSKVVGLCMRFCPPGLQTFDWKALVDIGMAFQDHVDCTRLQQTPWAVLRRTVISEHRVVAGHNEADDSRARYSRGAVLALLRILGVVLNDATWQLKEESLAAAANEVIHVASACWYDTAHRIERSIA